MGLLGVAHGWEGSGGQKVPPSLKSVTHPGLMRLGIVIPHQKNI